MTDQFFAPTIVENPPEIKVTLHSLNVEEAERRLVLTALNMSDSQKAAADLCGINRHRIRRIMIKNNIKKKWVSDDKRYNFYAED